MILNDKYFHSIHSYVEPYDDLEQDLKLKLLKLNRIFESGSIFCNRKILEKYGETLSHPYKNINGVDLISISRYRDCENEFDLEYKQTVSPQHFEDAFESFILQEPSIVLDSQIEKDLKIYNFGIYLERLVLNDIPLKYMKAISVLGVGMIEPFFKQVNNDKYEECYSDSFYKNRIYLQQLDSIHIILKKFGYDVPIVDILTGNEYRENLEYRKYIETKKKK